MSRIGKQPIPLPSGVDAVFKDSMVSVKGPKGELQQDLAPGFDIKIESGEIQVVRPSDQKRDRAKHGLYRSLVSNMVEGVSKGFETTLEIEGVGYNAKVQGSSNLTLNIGFCHPVEMTAPEGVSLTAPNNTTIVVSGADKQKVGQFSANIRRVRPPEPYKGKGIRYKGEYIRRKQGKAAGK